MRNCGVAQGAQPDLGDGMDRGRETGEGGNVCIIMVDLHCCMAETNTTL